MLSSDHFSYFENVSRMDSQLGILPILCSICKLVNGENDSIEIRDLSYLTRRLMILEETYLGKYMNKKTDKKIKICNMTNPEKIFFETGVPYNYLGTNFSNNLFSDLKSNEYLKDYDLEKENGCYHVERDNLIQNRLNTIRELNSCLSSFSNNNRPFTILGPNLWDASEELDAVKQRIHSTKKLNDVLSQPNLSYILKSILSESGKKSPSMLKQNKINFPLAGIWKIYANHSRSAMYLLTYYEHDSIPKSKKSLHIRISAYVQTLFDKIPELKNILNDLRKLNHDNVEPVCYVKTLLATPKSQNTAKKYSCAFHMFGFERDMILANQFNHIPLHELIPHARDIGWDDWCPVRGDFITIPLSEKKKEEELK